MIEERPSRRELLRSIGRWAAFGGLAATGAGLAARSLTQPEDCRLANPCRGCPSFDGCRLPRAGAVRSDRSEK